MVSVYVKGHWEWYGGCSDETDMCVVCVSVGVKRTCDIGSV